MKLIIDIPNYNNLNDIQNGSIACSQVLRAVKNGKPYEERPHGEWLDEKFVAFHLTCNKCGCNLRKQKNEVFEGDFDYNYCPNCGVDMRKLP